jgi:hypothetical protein
VSEGADEARFSDDGHWWWTGTEWVPAAQAPTHLARPVAPSPPAVANQVLQAEIARYLRGGYRVVSETSTSVQLVKPKKFGCFVFAVLLLLGLVPGLIYAGYYASKKDHTIYITVGSSGQLTYN